MRQGRNRPRYCRQGIGELRVTQRGHQRTVYNKESRTCGAGGPAWLYKSLLCVNNPACYPHLRALARSQSRNRVLAAQSKSSSVK